MPIRAQVSHARQRQRGLHRRNAPSPPLERHDLDHPQPHTNELDDPPPNFWDSLSKIWLTERALRELDRRNAPPSPPHPSRRAPRGRRPLTRSATAARREKRQQEQQQQRQNRLSVVDFIRNATREDLNNLRRFQGPGGGELDLSDLRGVRILKVSCWRIELWLT